MTAEPIRLTGVRHRYRRVSALDGVDLEIPAGTLFGVIGPDGVGKSTLLGLITVLSGFLLWFTSSQSIRKLRLRNRRS